MKIAKDNEIFIPGIPVGKQLKYNSLKKYKEEEATYNLDVSNYFKSKILSNQYF